LDVPRMAGRFARFANGGRHLLDLGGLAVSHTGHTIERVAEELRTTIVGVTNAVSAMVVAAVEARAENNRMQLALEGREEDRRHALLMQQNQHEHELRMHQGLRAGHVIQPGQRPRAAGVNIQHADQGAAAGAGVRMHRQNFLARLQGSAPYRVLGIEFTNRDLILVAATLASTMIAGLLVPKALAGISTFRNSQLAVRASGALVRYGRVFKPAMVAAQAAMLALMVSSREAAGLLAEDLSSMSRDAYMEMRSKAIEGSQYLYDRIRSAATQGSQYVYESISESALYDRICSAATQGSQYVYESISESFSNLARIASPQHAV